MGELIGYADQITSYGFSSTDLGNKARLHTKSMAECFQMGLALSHLSHLSHLSYRLKLCYKC
ncbi:hypothetical protein, partial [Shewanella xiamenensis]|uniref:hypothetical protein n=1 Tax=Shewanella xiamenensis TaxID=332186 RepID=UPI0035B92B40